MTVLPTGAWPVMLTPFHDDASIDWAAVDTYTDWLIDRGAAGLFAVALSGEMYELTAPERVQLAERVVRRAAGRVPVVASAVGTDVAEIAEAAADLAEVGVDAVVLISSLLAGPDDGDTQLLDAVGTVLRRTDGVDLGIYECPIPYKRLLSDRVLAELAATDRFVFLKDTSQDPELMARRVTALSGTRLRHYNAEIGSLTATLRSGSHGFSGFAANVYPDLVAWLCAEHARAPEAEVLATQHLLTVAEMAFGSRYPSSAKYLLASGAGLPFTTMSRWRPDPIGPAAARGLDQLTSLVEAAGLPRR